MKSAGVSVIGLVLVGLIVGVAVLLIAGFGVGVGIGIIGGVILGLVGTGAALGLTRRDPSFGWSTSRMPDAEPGLTDTDAFMRDYTINGARVADVDVGALTRVLSVGSEASAYGVRVELIAVELRTDGGIASLVSHTRPPIGQPGHFADVRVTDDAGTEYVAAAQGTGQPSPSTTRLELRFSPAPPPTGTQLTIEIQRFVDPFPESRTRPVEGPWSFTIGLDGPNTDLAATPAGDR